MGKDLLQAGLRRKYRWNYKMIMWDMIDTMDEPKDYLQVFDLSEGNGKQKIVHSQEQPEYEKEYLFETGTPFFCVQRFFVIDDVTHSTMLFNYEY